MSGSDIPNYIYIDNRLIDLKLFMDAADEFNLRNASSRRRLQKTVYFAWVNGLDMGYRFGYHSGGPYSESLAEAMDDYLGDQDEIDKWAKEASLTDDSRAKIEELCPLLISLSNTGLNPVEWLELLAAVHYIKHVAFLHRKEELGHDWPWLSLKISGLQRKFTLAQINEAKEKLEELGFWGKKPVE